MNSSVRLAWSILGVSAFFAIAGVFSLFTFSILSLVSLPGFVADFAKAIAEAQDISMVKKVCLLLSNTEERDRVVRLHFALWGICLVVLLSTVCAGLSARLLFLLHQANCGCPEVILVETQSRIGRLSSRAFGGKLKLWQAFWFLYLPIPTILYVGFACTFAALRNFGELQGSFLLQFVAFPLLISFVYLSFIAVSVAVWRCSNNTNHRIWSFCARILVILNIAGPLLKLAVIWLRM